MTDANTTTTTDETTLEFSSEDMIRLIDFNIEIDKFKTFVLGRFKDYIKATQDIDVDEAETAGGGDVNFELDERSLFDNGAYITVYKTTFNRETGSKTSWGFGYPKDVLFADAEGIANHVKFKEFQRRTFGF